eukprot:COSAG03_NODE_12128_length_560_cov_0.776573_2_plen_132_part_01
MLILHLKRFSYTRSSREKVDEEVLFPLTSLDLSSSVLDPTAPAPIYDLYAVSNHLGGYGGGHYTAFAKNRDRWVEFDDSSAKDVDESAVQSAAAYVLFYRRRPRQQQIPTGLAAIQRDRETAHTQSDNMFPE